MLDSSIVVLVTVSSLTHSDEYNDGRVQQTSPSLLTGMMASSCGCYSHHQEQPPPPHSHQWLKYPHPCSRLPLHSYRPIRLSAFVLAIACMDNGTRAEAGAKERLLRSSGELLPRRTVLLCPRHVVFYETAVPVPLFPDECLFFGSGNCVRPPVRVLSLIHI